MEELLIEFDTTAADREIAIGISTVDPFNITSSRFRSSMTPMSSVEPIPQATATQPQSFAPMQQQSTNQQLSASGTSAIGAPSVYNASAFKCDVAAAGLSRMVNIMQTNDINYLDTIGIDVQLSMAEKYWAKYYEAFVVLGGFSASPEEQQLLEQRYIATEYSYTTLLTLLNTRKKQINNQQSLQATNGYNSTAEGNNGMNTQHNLYNRATEATNGINAQHCTINHTAQVNDSCEVHESDLQNPFAPSYAPPKHYWTVTEPHLMVHEADSLNIQPFDSDKDPAYWPVFKDAFINFYHRRQDMNNITKMNRLIGNIVTNTIAHDILCRYTCTEANYSLAWESLCETFDNPGRIVDDIITKFLNQPIFDKPTRIGILRITNSVTHLLQVLKTHGIQTDSWDTIVINLALRRLDSDTRRAWRAAQDPKIVSNVSTFVKFMTRRAYTIDDERQAQSQNRSAAAAAPVSSLNNNRITLRSSSGKRIVCALCNEQHLIYKCSKFTEMNRDKRGERVKKLQLCQRCLRDKHKSNNQCTFSMCPYCGGDHNGLLCPVTPKAATATVVKSNRN